MGIDFFFSVLYNSKILGRLAQLVRASGLHPECRRFDPVSAHNLFLANPKKLLHNSQYIFLLLHL